MKISINISIYFLVSVACITILAPFSIDAYIPATVDISKELLASSNSVQLSIAIFLMGFSLGPLIFGPLSDAFGRRKLICLSLIFFSLFSFLCSLSTNIYLLIFFRFFQAVSGSVGTVCGRAAVADLFSGNKLAKNYSILGLILTIAPILAPIIGGWINEYFGWRYIFVFMALSGALFFLISFFNIPETLKSKDRTVFDFNGVFLSYIRILKNRTALFYILFLSSTSAVFFAFLAASPFLYIQQFGLTPIQYSYVFGSGAVIAAVSNIINIKFTSIIGYKKIIVITCYLILLNAIVLFFGGLEILDRWSIYLSGLLFMGLFHIANATSLTGLMDEFEKNKGAANALAISLRFGFGMIGAGCVSIMNDKTIYPYIFTVMFFSCFAMISGLKAVRNN